MIDTSTFEGRLQQHGLSGLQIEMLEKSMSDGQQKEVIAIGSYRELQAYISEFSATKKEAGEPHIHP